jgi:acyl carrier protein
MRKDQTIEGCIKEIIFVHLGVGEDEVTPTASLFDDLGADSLDAVELIMAIEEEFDISVPNEEAEEIKTVQQVIDCVTRHTRK